jgi:hypothetical protein
MFRWHDQVAADPEARRQALALRAVTIIRQRVSANTLEAMIDQRWLAKKLNCSVYGLQKALRWLVRRGHLEITCRKHLGRPNLYFPIVREVPTGVGTPMERAMLAARERYQQRSAPGTNPKSETVPTPVGRNPLSRSTRDSGRNRAADEIEGRKLAKKFGASFEQWQALPDAPTKTEAVETMPDEVGVKQRDYHTKKGAR